MSLVRLEAWENLFPVSDWRYEVDNDDTRLGREEWLQNRTEMEMDDIKDAVERLAHGATRSFRETPGLEAVARVVAETFSALRMCDDEAYARSQSVLGNDYDPDTLIFGETFCVLPERVQRDLSRLAHLGMVAWEGRADFETIDQLAIAIHCNYGLAEEAAEAAARRLDLDDHEMTVKATPDALAAFSLRAREALAVAIERLEINDIGGEEAPFLADIRAALVMGESLAIEPEIGERFVWPQSVQERIADLNADEADHVAGLAP